MPRSILVVDDEPAVRQVLDHLLSTQGWRVEQAESGSAALARLDAAAFDAILCDLDLRGDIDGIELLRRMPAMNHQTPFLLLTGHGSVARCREAFLLGAADFLEKPILPAALTTALSRAVAHHIGQDASPEAGGAPAMDDSPDPLDDSPAAAKHVRAALAHIERQFSKPDFSIAALADHVGVTQAHLARLFTARLGHGPLAELHRHRIRVAEALLRDDALSIFAIATDVGYRNASEFDAHFRKRHGCTPGQWRSDLRKRSNTPY